MPSGSTPCSGSWLLRYDERGCGLSDWDTERFSFDAWVEDLETVVDAVGMDQFALLGISQGPVAIGGQDISRRRCCAASANVSTGAAGRAVTVAGFPEFQHATSAPVSAGVAGLEHR